jgi:hypothetical protein
MKEYIKKIKILYDNKKYRSLVILLFYIVAFAIIISIMQFNAKHPIKNEELDPFINLDKMTSYAYKYTFTSTKEEDDFTIEGVRYQNQERLTYKTDAYYVIDNVLYSIVSDKLHQINDDLVNIKLSKLNPKDLKTLIESANKDYSKANDGIVTEQYTLSLIKFLQVYNPLESTIDNSKNVYLTVTKNKNNIVSILIDLTNYFQEKNQENKLLIEYTDINKIDNFNISYEKEELIES